MRERIEERIVTVGGGTGSFTVMSELKRIATHVRAIVAMTDSGGSSRRLMDEFGRPLPMGDLRQALVALSRSSRLWGDIFNYRFPQAGSGPVGGHSLGNLILAALEALNENDLLGALEDAEEMLNAGGKVIPVTIGRTTLCAELADGTVVRGETTIDRRGYGATAPLPSIVRMFVEPPVAATPRARKALERADRVLICPGDLYTSIVPCLLVDGIADAIRSCDGEVIYVCNVMSKQGETDSYKASDFVREIHRYLRRRVDSVIVNIGEFPEEQLSRYAEQGSYPIEADIDTLHELVPRVISGSFFSAEKLIRHDAERVLLALWPHLAS